MRKATGQSTRWWEFYVVRYTMGSVVGACIISFLADSEKIPVGFQFTITAAGIGGNQHSLIWLILLGITYCYIASAPILVFHLGRFLMRHKQTLIAPLATTLLLSLLAAAFATCKHGMTAGIATFAVFVVLLSQAFVVFLCIRMRGYLTEFYRNLSHRRSVHTGDFIESYRHLKEHGNSFFIVLCEIVFAAAIYFLPDVTGATMKDHAPFIYFTAVWIIPAVIVWFAATILEHKFSLGEGETP